MATGAGALPISNGHLALSALLIVVNVALSALLRLELGRSWSGTSARRIPSPSP